MAATTLSIIDRDLAVIYREFAQFLLLHKMLNEIHVTTDYRGVVNPAIQVFPLMDATAKLH